MAPPPLLLEVKDILVPTLFNSENSKCEITELDDEFSYLEIFITQNTSNQPQIDKLFATLSSYPSIFSFHSKIFPSHPENDYCSKTVFEYASYITRVPKIYSRIYVNLVTRIHPAPRLFDLTSEEASSMETVD